MKKAVVVFSGGPDSTASVLWALENDYEVNLLTFQFKAQRQYGELLASMIVASTLQLHQTIIDFKSPLEVFEPNVHILMHAGVEPSKTDKSKSHRLEFGAGMILSTAASFAVYHDIHTVIWGATRDDASTGTYEYTQDFANGMASLVEKTVGPEFSILVPFSNSHKFQVFEKFKGHEDLFATTWSCKEGITEQSGSCYACIARRTAAAIVGFEDRTHYLVPEFVNPLSPEQLKNIHQLSDEDAFRIFESPK